MEIFLNEWIIVNIIIVFSALLQAITGFGFAIMATPFLLMVMESRDCIQISIILSFFMSITMLPQVYKDVEKALFKRLVIGSIIGAPIGLWLFVSMPVQTVKLVVGVTVMIVALGALLRSKPGTAVAGGKKKTMDIYVETGTGVASGALTTSIGMPGVPLALYFSRGHIIKEYVRGTTLVFFVLVYTISILLQASAGELQWTTIKSSLMLIPATIVGTFVGSKLFNKINQRKFQLLVNAILLYTGLHMLWNL